MADNINNNPENFINIKKSDFFKKIRLSDFGINQEKFRSIFSAYDKDGSGELEFQNKEGKNEIKALWNDIQSFKMNENRNNNLEADEIKNLLENKELEDETIKNFSDFVIAVKNIIPSYKTAIDFLENLVGNANKTVAQRDLEQGVISESVDFFYDIFNSELSEKNVKKVLMQEQKNLEKLKASTTGNLQDKKNNKLVSFEDAFYIQRGVHYDKKKVEKCSELANECAEMKTSIDVINQIKGALHKTTLGDLSSRMNHQEAGEAILKAFKSIGINDINKINEILADIEKKNPEIQRFGTDLKIMKDKNDNKVVYRITEKGYPAEATVEQLQIIAKEMCKRLDNALANKYGIKSNGDVSSAINKKYEEKYDEYLASFKKAYGEVNIEKLAETYVLTQRQNVAYIEMAINLASMALMVVPGVGQAVGGAVKAAQVVNVSTRIASTVQKFSPLIMTSMTLSPTQLVEKLTSEKGMSPKDWNEWGEQVLQNLGYMAAGMGASKVAQNIAAMYKTKALVSALKETGKSTDEIIAMVNANPVKFPTEILESFKNIDKVAKTLQVGNEVVLDLISTIALNKMMNNGELLTMDIINSIVFALMGGYVQKDFARLMGNKDKIEVILREFEQFGITRTEANNILKAMDEISAGKKPTNDVVEVKGEAKASSDAEIKEVGKSDFEVEYNDYKGLTGSITIKDSQGTQLGNVNYSILEQNGRKVLKFEGLESNKSGMNIGTKLIEELVLKSIELGAEGRLIAEASPATGSGANGRPISNLGFYYKLGFKANDPVIDAKIRECIESGKEIPLSLNIFTKISLTEEGINYITSKKGLNITQTRSSVVTDKVELSRLIENDEISIEQIKVKEQKFSTNDVVEVKGEAKVKVETPKVEISLGQWLETASSREEFVAIRDEIKAMPAGTEKTYMHEEVNVANYNVINEYCLKQKLNVDDVIKRFNDVLEHLDNKSVERLLQLTQENKLKLFLEEKRDPVFLLNRTCNDGLVKKKTKGILNYVKASDIEACHILKELLLLEIEGKISSENISEILKMYKYESDYVEMDLLAKDLVKRIQSGEISDSQIKQAQILAENSIPFEIFNYENIINYSKNNLRQWSLCLQSCRVKEAVSPEMLSAINKELMSLINVNEVNPKVSKAFLENFDNLTKTFKKTSLSIDNLAQAGGIKLQYSREAFKADVLKEIEHLSLDEQNKILSKFGLCNESNGRMSGLPIRLYSSDLNSIEKTINEHIIKFLALENDIILPKGFEDLLPFLKELCKAIPEFKFTIGAKQHKTQDHDLAGHMLKAFQENLKNPLYEQLGESDRKILGIATLLHDINKIERIVTPEHALPSSQTVNAIVERMHYLSPMEKDRIINLVKNHHWFEKIKDDPKVIEEMIIAFRSGNDFKLAKIFAESDLKAVNTRFFENFGHKINSTAIQTVEDGILSLQSKGRMMFTATVNTQKAIENGAVIRTVGEGSQATKNLVINAEQMGLDKTYFGYHASTDEGLITAISSGGFDKGLVLSISIGKSDECKVFNDKKYFLIFDKLNMNTLGKVEQRNANTKYGKDLDKILGYMKDDKTFVSKFRENYPHEISDSDYALVFREAQCLELSQISSDKNIQKILDSEAKAKDFQIALEKTNTHFVSSATEHSETVAFDLYPGAIGVKGKAEELSFELRKFLEERNIAIIENIK
ncbi:hypothetical protein J6R97_03850 [bacterium]|nr:hypothetical protein [bacterium]